MANSTSSSAVPGGPLGENAFLQLLTTQMKYQDPMSTQDSTQFVAQLAQFTSLEQMTNVAQTDQSILKSMQQLQSLTQMTFAHQMLGANVTVQDSGGNSIHGQVSSVQFQNGEAQLVINGTSYPVSSVVQMGTEANGG